MRRRAVPRLRDVGEHAWLARLTRRLAAMPASPSVLVGPGDDAAAVRAPRGTVLLTTDALVEGVHFRAGWLTPRALGARAFLVNASDVAAMGGTPAYALLALEAPPATPIAVLDGIALGVAAAAGGAGARLVGGNLARAPRLALTVTLVGTAAGRVVTRTGARPGDLLFVTGVLGATGLAVRRLRAGGHGRLPAPPLRLAAGRALARVAHAMLDVSDGLVQDLGHLCRASGVGARVDLARVPVAPACRRAVGAAAARFAATAGEDYELLCAVPPARASAVARLGCRVTCIGEAVAGPPHVALHEGGRPVQVTRGGWDHFR
jgi:thiamine-monophosphate kinase